jgi:dethiobiotin synthetase
MRAVFVTGTGTEVGKTLVCGLLARYLNEQGLRAVTQKWIQTGSTDDIPEDIATHLCLMDRDVSHIASFRSDVCPYQLKLPASAHLAGETEKRVIDPEEIKKSTLKLVQAFDRVIVEGIGGALVPYSREGLVIDIVQTLDLPVVIVARNKLGAINHTLLTIEALQARGLEILGVVFNSAEYENARIAQDNPQIVADLTGQCILGTLPWTKELYALHDAFKPIGASIKSAWDRGSKAV